MATWMNEANARDANSVGIQVPISEGLLAQSSHPVLGLPYSPANRRCGRLQRASHGPASKEEGNLQKPRLREDSLDFQEERDTVREQDPMLQLALNGDQEALGSVFASHMPQLYRAALRILGTPQDAEEALQDGLLGATLHLGGFECRARFSTWLTRVVMNAALMRLRKSRREVLLSIDQKLDRGAVGLADRVTDPSPNPEEIYQWKERLQLFERKLQKLAFRLPLSLVAAGCPGDEHTGSCRNIGSQDCNGKVAAPPGTPEAWNEEQYGLGLGC